MSAMHPRADVWRPRRASIEVSGTGVPVFSRYPLATSLNRRKVSM
jgi:hypothetical protein